MPVLPDHVFLVGYLSSAPGAVTTSLTAIPLYDVEDSTYAKSLAGVADGTNKVFSTRYVSRASNTAVYYNGLRMTNGLHADYTISGKVITFNAPPSAGSLLVVVYQATILA